jgi:hypothetical protein
MELWPPLLTAAAEVGAVAKADKNIGILKPILDVKTLFEK